MATLLGVNATSIATVPSGKAIVGQQGGRVNLIYDKFTLTADLSLNDIIQMGGLIPKGALIVDAYIKYADLSSGAGATLGLGWQASEDALEATNATGFISAADASTAAKMVKGSDNLASPASGKKFLGSCQPIVTISGDTNAVVGDIEVFILYALT